VKQPHRPWVAAPVGEKLFTALERFLHIEAAGGIVLLLAAALALAWANSPWAASYDAIWHAPVTLGIGTFISIQSLHFWINDGLMTIFFLVVGLEIRREIHEGALSSLGMAAVPLIAASGGVIVPALIYVAFNMDPLTQRGWAVPTATDIAFAVGILALLGKRVPPVVRVLLLALAIIDDIAAILVIAFFYSSGVKLAGLAITAAGIVGCFNAWRFDWRLRISFPALSCGVGFSTPACIRHWLALHWACSHRSCRLRAATIHCRWRIARWKVSVRVQSSSRYRNLAAPSNN
jgi:Na+/H+ antiporter NhaA